MFSSTAGLYLSEVIISQSIVVQLRFLFPKVGKSTSDVGVFDQPMSFISTNASNLQYAHVPVSGSAGCENFQTQATDFSS